MNNVKRIPAIRNEAKHYRAAVQYGISISGKYGVRNCIFSIWLMILAAWRAYQRAESNRHPLKT